MTYVPQFPCIIIDRSESIGYNKVLVNNFLRDMEPGGRSMPSVTFHNLESW